MPALSVWVRHMLFLFLCPCPFELSEIRWRKENGHPMVVPSFKLVNFAEREKERVCFLSLWMHAGSVCCMLSSQKPFFFWLSLPSRFFFAWHMGKQRKTHGPSVFLAVVRACCAADLHLCLWQQDKINSSSLRSPNSNSEGEQPLSSARMPTFQSRTLAEIHALSIAYSRSQAQPAPVHQRGLKRKHEEQNTFGLVENIFKLNAGILWSDTCEDVIQRLRDQGNRARTSNVLVASGRTVMGPPCNRDALPLVPATTARKRASLRSVDDLLFCSEEMPTMAYTPESPEMLTMAKNGNSPLLQFAELAILYLHSDSAGHDDDDSDTL